MKKISFFSTQKTQQTTRNVIIQTSHGVEKSELHETVQKKTITQLKSPHLDVTLKTQTKTYTKKTDEYDTDSDREDLSFPRCFCNIFAK